MNERFKSAPLIGERFFHSPRLFPQFGQKLPSMPVRPQVQSHVAGWGSGLRLPQLGQKFPSIPVRPQEQFHSPATTGAGFFAPQLGQKLPSITFFLSIQP